MPHDRRLADVQAEGDLGQRNGRSILFIIRELPGEWKWKENRVWVWWACWEEPQFLPDLSCRWVG